ncbi:MAG: sigma 54-interacting transcriptional regulator [Bryobacteraceae bacterium]
MARLAYCDPFLPERVEQEKAALGRDFVSVNAVWSASAAEPDLVSPNVARISERLQPVMNQIRERVARAAEVSSEELGIYEACVHYLLFLRFDSWFASANGSWNFYRNFLEEWNHYLQVSGKQFETVLEPAHVFACFRQIKKAFNGIFDNIIGSSLPAARLRASVWQSIFTHDMRRFRRTMYRRMPDFPTLITGPSGTGKELVARAIAQSRYVPFDAGALKFPDEQEVFLPINVAALSPTLIESELFGHRRGSFTGAIADRKGWLEACPRLGSVFLDEVGEMDLSIQVKLLRVIETRRFSPVGDTAQREFQGKLIAATNRSLQLEIQERRFREDLYYRLCADLIETPSLADQIEDSPESFRDLLLYMTRRAVGEEAAGMLAEVEEWIKTHLPRDYRWPGNYRELEQCVRNIVIRRSYRPIHHGVEFDATERFFEDFRAGRLKMNEVVSHYVAQVYRQTGSYEEAARRLALDRRTVKAKVQEYLLR